CHLHYFTFAVPLFMAMLAQHWEGKSSLRFGAGLTVLFAVFFVANGLPHFNELSVLRDVGTAMYSALLLLAVALLRARRSPVSAAVILDKEPPRVAAWVIPRSRRAACHLPPQPGLRRLAQSSR